MAQLPATKEPEYGEAMGELTQLQRNFVTAFLETGGRNRTEAAKMAGYQSGADVTACRLMKNPKVLAAIREESERCLKAGVFIGAKTIIDLAMSADKDSTRLKAAIELLNRGGLQLTQRIDVVHRDERAPADIEAQIIAAAKKLGLDPTKLLGYDPNVPVLDAEFEEVQPTDEYSSEGLEDVL